MKTPLVYFSLFIFLHGCAQHEIPVSQPEVSGLSKAGLIKIDSVMQRYVDEKKLPGMITMIARKGNIVSFQKYGNMNENKPMQSDAIFRIASMTKPVTSVAIMILYDKGRLQLDDPVSKYVPEFSDLKVYSNKDKSGNHLEN